LNVRSDEIITALAEKHKNDVFLSEVKTGPTWTARKGELFRLDAIALKKSNANPCVSAYEVKVSRSDFLGDSKWPAYMDYCNKFSFVCPDGLIEKGELPEEVGLLYYLPEKKKLKPVRFPKVRRMELSASMMYYLLISRTESDRHPFFNSRLEYLRAWTESRTARHGFGREVGTRLAEEVARLTRENEELTRKLDRTGNLHALFHALRQCLGDSLYIYEEMSVESFRKDITGLLSGKVAHKKIALDLSVAARAINKVIEAIGEGD